MAPFLRWKFPWVAGQSVRDDSNRTTRSKGNEERLVICRAQGMKSAKIVVVRLVNQRRIINSTIWSLWMLINRNVSVHWYHLKFDFPKNDCFVYIIWLFAAQSSKNGRLWHFLAAPFSFIAACIQVMIWAQNHLILPDMCLNNTLGLWLAIVNKLKNSN